MIREVDDELDSLIEAAKEHEPRLREVVGSRRDALVRGIREKTVELVDRGYTDPDEIAELVEAEMQLRFGGPIAVAILIAVIQFVVLKILRRIWPDRPVSFARYGQHGGAVTGGLTTGGHAADSRPKRCAPDRDQGGENPLLPPNS